MTVTSLALVMLSAFLDIIANLMLTKSKGFSKPLPGIIAIILVWSAFAVLGQAVKHMDLAVAYAIWGAAGILGTALGANFFLGRRLKPVAWVGIIVLTIAVIVMSTA